MLSLKHVISISLVLAFFVGGRPQLPSQHNSIANTAATAAQTDQWLGVTLGGTPQCQALDILGVKVNKARLLGRTADLSKVLETMASPTNSLAVKCAPVCDCALEGPSCLVSLASGVSTGDLGGPPPPSGTILLIIDDRGSPPGKKRSRAKSDPLIKLYDKARTDSQCKTELCVNTAGELSVSATCGDIKLKVSSSGKVTTSITRGNLTLNIP